MDGGGGVGGVGVGGGVERKVIIRRDHRRRFVEEKICKYHVAEIVCNKERRQD